MWTYSISCYTAAFSNTFLGLLILDLHLQHLLLPSEREQLYSLRDRSHHLRLTVYGVEA